MKGKDIYLSSTELTVHKSNGVKNETLFRGIVLRALLSAALLVMPVESKIICFQPHDLPVAAGRFELPASELKITFYVYKIQ